MRTRTLLGAALAASVSGVVALGAQVPASVAASGPPAPTTSPTPLTDFRLLALALPHGSDAERERSERIAAALGGRAESWPRLSLDALTDRMGRCAGAIGVDSGLSHIAVALDLPHVQIYTFDTAWRTGPLGAPHQRSVHASPTPGVEAVWRAWEGVTMPG